uniref:Uncharacterized protein n=1 Tax=uncultured bacterium contig00063 TaxID=1181546 RepID=A0A806JYY3_9BACT|nr:hypothetical protein [uncultured bacterium contig00063]
MEFNSPAGVSQRRMPVLPGLGFNVRPFVQMPPRRDTSIMPAYSLP